MLSAEVSNINTLLPSDAIKLEDTDSLLKEHHSRPQTCQACRSRNCCSCLHAFVQFKNWVAKLGATFDFLFLCLSSLVYYIQGFNSLTKLATKYLLKDIFHLQPAHAQTLITTMSIPWLIKPVYGILSDSLPICDYRRKPYLLIVNFFNCFFYIALSIAEIAPEPHIAFLFFLLTNVCTATTDVVIDAMVVELARRDPVKGAINLQSLTWTMYSLGGVIGSFIAGTIFHLFGIRGTFLFIALSPLSVFFLSLCVKENRVEREKSSCLLAAKTQLHLLMRAFRIPVVWRSGLFIFLSTSLSPAFGEIQFFFIVDVLHFSPHFIGTMSAIGYIFLMMTAIVYNSMLSGVKFRKILLCAQFLLAVVSLLDLMLVTRTNLKLGIPDKLFALGDEIVSDVILRLKAMPLLVLCAKVCPQGIEGTLFALLMSIFNIANALSSYFGAVLCHSLNITKANFDNFWIAIIVRTLLRLVPLLFLGLIPSIDAKSNLEEVQFTMNTIQQSIQLQQEESQDENENQI